MLDCGCSLIGIRLNESQVRHETCDQLVLCLREMLLKCRPGDPLGLRNVHDVCLPREFEVPHEI